MLKTSPYFSFAYELPLVVTNSPFLPIFFLRQLNRLFRRILFDSPITFSTKELRRLAPAMNPDISCLLLDITKEPVNIIGMIAAYTTWKRIQIKEIEHGNRTPHDSEQ